MKKVLHISKNFNLPLEAMTQSVTIVAKKRVGKSYTMRKVSEQILKAGQQLVLVDPKGDQWGIRSSADGKKPGFPILILGGEHGDLPLEKTSGELVAKLVVEEQVSVVLDLSMFRKYEIAIFMQDFLENLYRLKAKEIYRTPVTVVIDEADAIAPQQPQKGEERMLGAADDLVRRGGQRGIGVWLVTQRSAVLNKNVMTQSQILVVLRTIAPQDLKAITAWIDVHGTPEERKILMESLPSLPIGDAWFWSPGWPTEKGIFKRVHVDPIETFDSAKTPGIGERRVIPKNLADVDLNALKGQMAATIEKAKKDDPKELHKEIQRLSQELKKKVPAVKSDYIKTEVKVIEKSVLKDSQIARLEKWSEKMTKEAERHGSAMALLWGNFDEIGKALIKALDAIRASNTVERTVGVTRAPDTFRPPTVRTETIKRDAPKVDEADVKPLVGGGVRMMNLLASRYPMKFTRSQLALQSNMKARGGGFGNYLSTMKTNGFIIEEGGMIQATEAGIAYAGVRPEEPLSPEQTRDMWRGKLTGKGKDMFDVLVRHYPHVISKETLAEEVGMEIRGGGFGNYISTMRSNGIITVDRNGGLKMSEDLF